MEFSLQTHTFEQESLTEEKNWLQKQKLRENTVLAYNKILTKQQKIMQVFYYYYYFFFFFFFFFFLREPSSPHRSAWVPS